MGCAVGKAAGRFGEGARVLGRERGVQRRVGGRGGLWPGWPCKVGRGEVSGACWGLGTEGLWGGLGWEVGQGRDGDALASMEVQGGSAPSGTPLSSGGSPKGDRGLGGGQWLRRARQGTEASRSCSLWGAATGILGPRSVRWCQQRGVGCLGEEGHVWS